MTCIFFKPRTLSAIKTVQLAAMALLLSACAAQKIERAYDSDSEALKRALYAQFAEWRSVPYRRGGLSKAGVDCSGFVFLTFRDLWGVYLPRTVSQQAEIGSTVSQGQLTTGDLVFFKTGRQQKHVGIYLEDRHFLHVSTRRGVLISDLDNQYWSGRYWKAARVSSLDGY